LKVVTHTDALAEAFGENEAVKMLSGIGFDALDYSMFVGYPKEDEDYKERAYTLKKTADSCNITFEQAHAPFPGMLDENGRLSEKRIDMIVRAIEFAGILDAKYIVVHPLTLKENQKEVNFEYYNMLLPHCQKSNIKIVLENMWGWHDGNAGPAACSEGAEFAEYVDMLDKNWFAACLDIGHSSMKNTGSTVFEMINALGGRLECLHVHDNDLKDDLHMFPYLGSVDWNAVMSALKKSGYTGNLTFECDGFLRRYPKELYLPVLKMLLAVGRQLVKI